MRLTHSRDLVFPDDQVLLFFSFSLFHWSFSRSWHCFLMPSHNSLQSWESHCWNIPKVWSPGIWKGTQQQPFTCTLPFHVIRSVIVLKSRMVMWSLTVVLIFYKGGERPEEAWVIVSTDQLCELELFSVSQSVKWSGLMFDKILYGLKLFFLLNFCMEFIFLAYKIVGIS